MLSMNRMGITSSACIFTFAEVSFTIDFTLNTDGTYLVELSSTN